MNDDKIKIEEPGIEIFGIDDINTEVKSSDRSLQYLENPKMSKVPRDNNENKLYIIIAVVIVLLLFICTYVMNSREIAKEDNTLNDINDEDIVIDEYLQDDVPYQVEVTSEYYPLVVGRYKNIQVLLEGEETDLDVEVGQYISAQLELYKTSVEIEGASTEGDTLNIDYIVEVDGEIIESLTYEGFDLLLGSGVFIEGVEEKLLGSKAGDIIVIEVDFSDESSVEELAGKSATIKVEVNRVSSETPLELTDENIQEYLSEKSNTVQEYMQEVELNLKAPGDTESSMLIRTQVWNTFLGQFSLEFYVEEELEIYKEKKRKSIQTQAKGEDQTLEEYLEAKNMSDTEFEEFLIESAKQEILTIQAISYVADIEGLNPNEVEREEGIRKILTQIGYSSIEGANAAGYTTDELDYKVLSEIVLDWLVENAQIITE